MVFETGRDMKVTGWIGKFREHGSPVSEDAIRRVAGKVVDDHVDDERGDGKGRIRPSNAGEDCVRFHVLGYLGAPRSGYREEWEQMAQAGSWLHYKWQAELLSCYQAGGEQVGALLADIEVPCVLEEFDVRGRCDGMLFDGSLLEIKTMGADRFAGRKYGTTPVEDWIRPLPEHVSQVDVYMMCTGAERTHLVYVNRDSNAFREFVVRRDGQREDRLARRLLGPAASVSRALLAGASALPGVLPECLEPKSRRARWCKVSGFCLAAGDDPVALRSLLGSEVVDGAHVV